MLFQDIQKREALAAWRSDQLILLQARFGFTLPRNAKDWRAVEETWGTHNAQPDRSLCCVATDGMLGIFVDRSTPPRIFTLHVQYFVWNTGKSNMVSYYDKVEKKEKQFVVTRCDGAPPPLGAKASTKPKPKREKKVSLLQQAIDLMRTSFGADTHLFLMKPNP